MQAINITGFFLPVGGDPVSYTPDTVQYISTEQQAQITKKIEEGLRTECAQDMHGMRAPARGKRAKKAGKRGKNTEIG